MYFSEVSCVDFAREVKQHREMTDVLQRHEMVDEKDAFALEEFPNSLASLTLHFTDLR